MKLQNEDDIAQKHFNAVMNWTEQRMGEKVLREKLFVLYCTNWQSSNIYCLTRYSYTANDDMSREQEIVTKEFLERLGPYI